MIDPPDQDPVDSPNRDRDEEELIAALSCGDRDPSDPTVEAMFRADPDLRARFLRREKLLRELDGHGADDRKHLAAALRTPSPFDSMARELLSRHAPLPARRRWPWVLAAAAMLIVLISAEMSMRPEAANEDSTLGLAEGELRPQGLVAGDVRFTWGLELPRNGSFRIRFRKTDGNRIVMTDPVLEVGGLTTAEWRPSAEQRNLMTGQMAWEVDILNSSDEAVGGAGPVRIEWR